MHISFFFSPPSASYIKRKLFILVATDGMMTAELLKFALKFCKSVLSVEFMFFLKYNL